MYCYLSSGSYCPASTSFIPLTAPKPCPVGTYGDREGLEAEANCTQCDAGYYCDSTGKIYGICLSTPLLLSLPYLPPSFYLTSPSFAFLCLDLF